MLAEIRLLGIDYSEREIIEATVYANGQNWPPILIALSNTGFDPLKKRLEQLAMQYGETIDFKDIR